MIRVEIVRRDACPRQTEAGAGKKEKLKYLRGSLSPLKVREKGAKLTFSATIYPHIFY